MSAVPERRDPARISGLEYLRGIATGEFPRPPMMLTLGMEGVAMEEGRAVFRVAPDERHLNTMGIAHGGLASALCDTAMACAVHTLLPAGVGYTTLELKVNFVRPMLRGMGSVECEGKVIHLGSRVATAEARVTDGAGKLYAHATTTCLILAGAAAPALLAGPAGG